MSSILNFVTNVIAWLLKNVNMIVGVITSITKVVVSIINIFQPSKDKLVDKITVWSERLQKWLFKGCEILKNFKRSTK